MVGGIGGPGGAGKVGGPSHAAAPEATSGSKSTSFGEALGSVKQTSATGAASPLEALRSGQIDRAQYVDHRVTEATSHLEGLIAPADLEKVRAELRDALEHDPDLAALVRAAEIGS
jgi:hypothetical protein